MLGRMEPNKTQDAAEDALMRPAEASQVLGVTTRTLQRMAARGQLRTVRREGGYRRYLASDVLALRGGTA